MQYNLEKEFVNYIIKKTESLNIDNISRTKAYQDFYSLFPEIQWSLLASLVSRNAGWNMTDLMTPTFKLLLTASTRWKLFSTYERANWLIFSDAYPQLLVFQLSKTLNRPMFHLLPNFSVSTFMRSEWEYYWKYKDIIRLRTALIINEQNIIQSPVTQHPFYKHQVFLKWPYLFQDFLHMSAVIFPTRKGEMFALAVNDFSQVSKRIDLGKRLAISLFDKNKLNEVYDFCKAVEHTGSRLDYEQYLNKHISYSPELRDVYPIIIHQDKIRKDWYVHGGFKQKWWKDVRKKNSNNVWKSYVIKRTTLYEVSKLKKEFLPN